LLNRGLIVSVLPSKEQDQTLLAEQDRDILNRFNWAAFLLTPIWCLVYKLDRWAIGSHIPGINMILMLYMGFNGNKMAYERSSIDSVNDFMAVQEYWRKLMIRLIWLNVRLCLCYFIWLMFFE
jgi:hypothetical protein